MLNVVHCYTDRVVKFNNTTLQSVHKIFFPTSDFLVNNLRIYSKKLTKETRHLLQNSKEPLIFHPTASTYLPLSTQFAPVTNFSIG